MSPINYSHCLLKSVHLGLPLPNAFGETLLVSGDYSYYHYGCDGFDDRGWGCGYRTLQMLSSWITNRLLDSSPILVPSIPSIQEMLVSMEDKPSAFSGSRDWIGTYEAFLVIDNLFKVSSKILHVKQVEKFNKVLPDLKFHFEHFKSPIMIGGDMDCSSKGVVGIHYTSGDNSMPAYLLIVDPHFTGVAKNAEELQMKCWVKWQSTAEFMDSSFYNVCLPQMKFDDF
ncbi:ufm1-specific protease 1 [Hetaerina americana]|uniref:ufm1-specific protease 1 n=1 Tax=Hetaerina americana TaxID=62018 RepID=UPI003A7F551E